jgi:hypothetical protein
MSTSPRKYPKSIKKILVLDVAGAEPKKVDLGMTAEEYRTRKVSKAYRPFEAEVHAAALAAQRYSNKYLELHETANQEEKDGSVEHMGQHVREAQREAWKVFRRKSPSLKRQRKFFRQLVQW